MQLQTDFTHVWDRFMSSHELRILAYTCVCPGVFLRPHINYSRGYSLFGSLDIGGQVSRQGRKGASLLLMFRTIFLVIFLAIRFQDQFKRFLRRFEDRSFSWSEF